MNSRISDLDCLGVASLDRNMSVFACLEPEITDSWARGVKMRRNGTILDQRCLQKSTSTDMNSPGVHVSLSFCARPSSNYYKFPFLHLFPYLLGKDSFRLVGRFAKPFNTLFLDDPIRKRQVGLYAPNSLNCGLFCFAN